MFIDKLVFVLLHLPPHTRNRGLSYSVKLPHPVAILLETSFAASLHSSDLQVEVGVTILLPRLPPHSRAAVCHGVSPCFLTLEHRSETILGGVIPCFNPLWLHFYWLFSRRPSLFTVCGQEAMKHLLPASSSTRQDLNVWELGVQPCVALRGVGGLQCSGWCLFHM